jgi:hypothetical protein
MVPLAYVHLFEKPQKDPILKMFQVKRKQTRRKELCGRVIELDSITRFIQLTPNFQKIESSKWQSLNANNSADIPDFYLINNFADKEIYQAVW